MANEFGQLVRKNRERVDLTQLQLSKKLGYETPQFISNVERGVTAIPAKKFKRLSDALEISIKDLVLARVDDYADKLAKAAGVSR